MFHNSPKKLINLLSLLNLLHKNRNYFQAQGQSCKKKKIGMNSTSNTFEKENENFY